MNMPTDSSNEATESSEKTPATPARRKRPGPDASVNEHGGYVMPIVHVTVPEAPINLGFWAALGGAAVLGAVELPLAALIGVGVIIARHHSK
jgi:hypothetical protein